MAYNYIIDKGVEELFSRDFFTASTDESNPHNVLDFKTTPLLHLINEKAHPVDLFNESKLIVTAGFLGKTGSPVKTSELLQDLKIIEKTPSVWVNDFFKQIQNTEAGYNNIYLDVTSDCNLKCSHCYSFKDDQCKLYALPKKVIVKLAKQASDLHFRKIVFTGGEPLMHPEISGISSCILKII